MGRRRIGTLCPWNGQSCAKGPRQPHSGKSGGRTPKCSPSGTSTPSLSAPQTTSACTYTMGAIAKRSAMKYPPTLPSQPLPQYLLPGPFLLSSPSQNSVPLQQLALSPLATHLSMPTTPKSLPRLPVQGKNSTMYQRLSPVSSCHVMLLAPNWRIASTVKLGDSW